jgi:hypothetical protein
LTSHKDVSFPNLGLNILNEFRNALKCHCTGQLQGSIVDRPIVLELSVVLALEQLVDNAGGKADDQNYLVVTCCDETRQVCIGSCCGYSYNP